MSDSISFKSKDIENPLTNLKKFVERLTNQIPKTIKHFFPEFKRSLRKMEDFRKRPEYELTEIIMSAISLFLLKEGSRNALNKDRESPDFVSNYKKLFYGMELPHMDTVEGVFRLLEPEELEKFKVSLVRELIEKKVLHGNRLHGNRLLGKLFVVAVDGTGVMRFDKRHCNKCLVKEYESGKKGYFHNVLEAKLVLPNGLSISLATEWIENDSENYDKQDCELKAFKRLSKKLKKYFPRLPICIVGDGLYPNQTVFGICEKNQWEHIIVLKEGNLRSVWEEVKLLSPLQKENKFTVTKLKVKGKKETNHNWITGIDYKGYNLNWIRTEEKPVEEINKSKKYVFITSLDINEKTAAQISQSGRLRWKIENEGFNDQKNNGYRLEHKYSEVSLTASKNYYQSLQIASMINQLLVLGQKLKKLKTTIKHIWKHLLAFLHYGRVDEENLLRLLDKRIQIRLE